MRRDAVNAEEKGGGGDKSRLQTFLMPQTKGGWRVEGLHCRQRKAIKSLCDPRFIYISRKVAKMMQWNPPPSAMYTVEDRVTDTVGMVTLATLPAPPRQSLALERNCFILQGERSREKGGSYPWGGGGLKLEASTQERG